MTMREQKVTCLFVHGWAMNSTIWQPVLEQLPEWVDAKLMDLPGHGQRANESFSSLQDLTDDLQKQCAKIKKPEQPLVLVGWSLGGLPCLQLAIKQSEDIDALMLVSSNPCFVGRENWPLGIEGEIFIQFSDSLKKDFSGTIRRFLSLQVKGSDSGRELLRRLREKILQQPKPNESSLDAGLQLLQQVDLRNELEKIRLPISWVLGEQDGLVKAELAAKLDNSVIINKAGHAPFLSHTDEFIQHLIMCIQKIGN